MLRRAPRELTNKNNIKFLVSRIDSVPVALLCEVARFETKLDKVPVGNEALWCQLAQTYV